jgi:hypothetical protein
MQEVTVNREELLEVVKENCKNHRIVFEKALEGYRKAVIDELEKMLVEAKEGKRIGRSVNLVEPMDQTKEYERLIKMLEMSVEDEIDLNQHEFGCYVMDQWQWRDQFVASNSYYVSEGDLPANAQHYLNGTSWTTSED